MDKVQEIQRLKKLGHTKVDNVADVIMKSMKSLTLRDIRYKKIDNNFWEMQRIEKDAENIITRYIKNLYKVKNEDKTICKRPR